MRRLQNRIATSRLSLPVTALCGLALWGVLLLVSPGLWPGLLIFIASVCLMVELNNRNALMRQYSRMVSCAYVAMMMMCPWLLADTRVMAVQLCLLATLTLLFMSYQQPADLGHKYWAYLFVGLAALVWPPVVALVPLMWIGERAFLMSFSFKALLASLLGLLTPAWIATPVVFLGRGASAPRDVMGYIMASVSQYTTVPASPYIMDYAETSVMTLFALLLIIGIVHFFRQSYADKIHVRMLYQFFTMLAVALALAVAAATLLPNLAMLSPDYALGIKRYALSIEVVCLSPLVAHFVTFTSSRLTNITVLCLIAIAAATAAGDTLLLIMSGLPAPLSLPWTL